MIFLNSVTPLIWLFLSIFLLFYLILMGKTVYVALKLKSTFKDIFIKFILRSIYFSLILFSLLAPTFGNEKRQEKSYTKNIFLAVDVSPSMNCTDILPNRLSFAKMEIEKLISKITTDKVALILYTDTAQIVCPLTKDYNLIKTYLRNIHSVPNASSDVSSALELYYKKTKSSEEDNVMIIFSDGEQYETDKIEALKTSLSLSNVITYGIGTQEGSKIPKARGGFYKNKNGDFEYSKLNSELLTELSEEYGGKYFQAKNNSSEIEACNSYLNNIKSNKTTVNEVKVKENKYIYFLSIAFLLIIFDILLNVKIIHL